MSGPFGSSQWMYSSGGFYDFPIEQSLKFNDDDSSYLSWTPASAGNRKTWTWSGWVKRGNIGTDQLILHCYDGSSSNRGVIRFSFDDLLEFDTGGSGSLGRIDSLAVFRDTSAWYHIVAVMDTSNATATDRQRLYVNGERIAVTVDAQVAQNFDGLINTTNNHQIGSQSGAAFFDGYLAEVNFIDGQALDASSFGEFKSGVWIPKDPSGLTYGTNGFRLSFQNDTVSEGFNTVTYRGTGGPQSISGIGFTPDFLWFKNRSSATEHGLHDSVRGVRYLLNSDGTGAELDRPTYVSSIDADGFSFGDNVSNYNAGGNSYVAWCWDAGSGSPVSNTDGSITSTVKANTAYGFSIISYTGTGSNATVGHGLSSAPEMIIHKNRDNGSANWVVYVDSLGAGGGLRLNTTGAFVSNTLDYNNTAPTSSVFSVGNSGNTNQSGNEIIAYAFHSVTNYSKVGSYSGSGSSGNAITTGFKPAFVMIKRTDTSGADWFMYDNTRATYDTIDKYLAANTSGAEATFTSLEFTDTGFTMQTGDSALNGSGGTYVYLAFADTRDNAFWRDQSGNGNDWQPNNLTYQDSLPDSTTNNFATFNPNAKSSGVTLSEGNLKADGSSSGQYGTASTFGMTSGKWYSEYVITDKPSTGNADIGIFSNASGNPESVGVDDGAKSCSMRYGANDGQIRQGNTEVVSTGLSWANGDILSIAFDMDDGKIWFAKNGVWYNSGDPAAGTNASYSSNLDDDLYFFVFSDATSGDTTGCFANFGQDSSFAGNKPAQGNTDDNGIGDFYYAPPSGYLALCTANLPDPVIDPAQDDVPSDYFNTVTWTGTGSVQSITGVGFQPDFFWGKQRNANRGHILQDVVRGTTKVLNSHNTNAEVTSTAQVTSFDADGFTLGTDPELNAAGGSHVGWNWLAGNGTSSNTDGSISSTISVNQKAGFSVVSYTGNGTNQQTVGHGIGLPPKMVIVKNRSGSDATFDNWWVYHTGTANPPNRYLKLNAADAQVGATDFWWNNPTSSVFGLSNSGDTRYTNDNGDNYIAYCFADVEGYSKFGSFGSTNSTDGPFVYCGFRPALVIYKATDYAANWEMIDATRNPYNVGNARLFPSSSSAESTAETSLDLLSNGFKVRDNYGGLNLSGNHIFMAFAENPFKYANAR